MDPITKEDLHEQTANIKEYLDLKLVPIKEDVSLLKKTVYGRTGSNGLAGSVKVLKWGYVLLAGVILFFAKAFFKL